MAPVKLITRVVEYDCQTKNRIQIFVDIHRYGTGFSDWSGQVKVDTQLSSFSQGQFPFKTIWGKIRDVIALEMADEKTPNCRAISAKGIP